MKPSPLFSTVASGEKYYDDVNNASIKGVSIKTFILLGIAVVVAVLTAIFLPTILESNPYGLYVALCVSSVVGFITVMIGRMSERASKYCGCIYAVCEGLFIGTLSRIVEEFLPGTSVIAVFSTLIIYFIVLALFSMGIIKNSNGFRKFALAICFSALALVLFTSIFNIFMPIQNLGVLIAIEAFLLFYGVIALILNFMEASAMVEAGCSKNSEWCVALGMTVSLIYIYLEILRLIILISGSRKD